MKRKLPVTDIVECVGEQILIVADDEGSEPDEIPSLPELIEIEQHLFFRLQAAFLATFDGILFAFLGARIIVVAASPDGHAPIRFLDVRHHLLVERVLEGFQALGHRLGVSVLRLEILDDLRIRFLAKPEIVVAHRGPMSGFMVLDDRRNGRRLGRP